MPWKAPLKEFIFSKYTKILETSEAVPNPCKTVFQNYTKNSQEKLGGTMVERRRKISKLDRLKRSKTVLQKAKFEPENKLESPKLAETPKVNKTCQKYHSFYNTVAQKTSFILRTLTYSTM